MVTLLAVVAVLAGIVTAALVVLLVWAQHRQAAYRRRTNAKVAHDLGAYFAEEDRLIRRRRAGRRSARGVRAEVARS